VTPSRPSPFLARHLTLLQIVASHLPTSDEP
jgi:hypothetical protein